MKHLLWLDMEMTGLRPETDRILEVAAIVTDLNFQVLETWEAVVFQPPSVLEGMDAWCKEHHGKSGLTARVPGGILEDKADAKLLEIGRRFFASDKIVLAGNSIWQDRRFVERYLPLFSSALHYRMLDVSAWKLVFENVYGKKYQKKEKHRALEDIEESISELKYYLGSVDVSKLTLVP
jgi:oligoribonuclease